MYLEMHAEVREDLVDIVRAMPFVASRFGVNVGCTVNGVFLFCDFRKDDAASLLQWYYRREAELASAARKLSSESPAA